jgi:sporulation protein YlmC with PRC-barrel domain
LVKKRSSELIGKSVSDADGTVLGKVIDAELDLDGYGFCLVVANNQSGERSKELIVAPSEIAKVKDIILLKTTYEKKRKACEKCGFENPIIASFCRECGTTLG